MKVISIFLASSIVDFAEERQELKAYVQQLNQDIFVQKGFYLELKICEYLRKYVERDGKQNYYDYEIENSDYFILLSNSKNIGEYTLHELEIALNKHTKSNNKPEVYICVDDKSKEVQQKIKKIYEQNSTFLTENNFVVYKDLRSIQKLLDEIAEEYSKYPKKEDKCNIVNIVLSSSINKIDKAYIKMLNQIASQNDVYVKREIFTKLLCLHKDSDIQKIYKKNADFYLITDDIIEKKHAQELITAAEYYNKYDSPKVYTYIIKLSETKNYDEVIHQLVEILDSANKEHKHNVIDKNCQHYVSDVMSIDQICLEILNNLTKFNPSIEIIFKDGHVLCDSRKVMSLENIPAYKHNEKLQKLKSELHNLNKSDTAYSYKRKKEIIKEISEIELDLLDVFIQLNTSMYYRCEVDPINESAVQEFNRGNIGRVIEILKDKDVIHNEKKRINDINNRRNNDTKYLNEIINRKKLLVSAIKAKRDRYYIKDVIKVYDELIKITKNYAYYDIDMHFLYDYIEFLLHINMYSKAIKLMDGYHKILKEKNEIDDFAALGFMNDYALLLVMLEKFDKARIIYKNLCNLINQRRFNNYEDECVLRNVATIYNNYSSILLDLNRLDDANKYCDKAFKIRKKIYSPNSSKDAIEDFGKAYILRADNYIKRGNYDVAKVCFQEGISLLNTIDNNVSLGIIYDNYANFLEDRNNKQSEEFHQKSISVLKQLAENERIENIDLGISYLNYANFLFKIKRKKEAMQYYLDSIKLFHKIKSKDNNSMYVNRYLGQCYWCYSKFLKYYNMKNSIVYYNLAKKVKHKQNFNDTSVRLDIYFIDYRFMYF